MGQFTTNILKSTTDLKSEQWNGPNKYMALKILEHLNLAKSLSFVWYVAWIFALFSWYTMRLDTKNVMKILYCL